MFAVLWWTKFSIDRVRVGPYLFCESSLYGGCLGENWLPPPPELAAVLALGAPVSTPSLGWACFRPLGFFRFFLACMANTGTRRNVNIRTGISLDFHSKG